MAYNILKLNEISPVIDEVLGQGYSVLPQQDSPDAVLLRSFKMHDYPLPDSLLAVARCGAGVNNIPIDKCTEKGIVVFNTPGANANAVKELVLCAMLLASRKILPAAEWAQSLKGKGADVPALVEKGKGSFAGRELLGKTLGVIGLGAIGAQVANAADSLGMTVYGYDPFISVDAAWRLSRSVVRIKEIERIFSECDYISLHVPLMPQTKEIINAAAIAQMKQDAAIINMSRGELVNNADILQAIESGKLSRYVTDFPAEELLGRENVICIPHLGASTPEAEDNCAFAAAAQLKDYLENGNIVNSVNFHSCTLPAWQGLRITVVHRNVKGMINLITAAVSSKNINIEHLVNTSQGDYAYCMLDINAGDSQQITKDIAAIPNVIRVRVLGG